MNRFSIRMFGRALALSAAAETETVFDVNDAKNGISHGGELWGYTWKNEGTGKLATVSTAPAEGDGFAAAFYSGGGAVQFNISDVQKSGDAGAAFGLFWANESGKPYNKDISAWKGVYITYSLTTTSSGSGIDLKLSTLQTPEGGSVNEGDPLTGWDEYKTVLTNRAEVGRVYFPFFRFSQGNWGTSITRTKALQSSHGFMMEAGWNATVNLTVTKVELSTDTVYYVTTSAASGGSIDASMYVVEGDSVVITAKPNSGRVVLGWVVDGVTVEGYTAKTLTLRNVSKATKVEVYFKEGVDAVAEADRVIPQSAPSVSAAVAPVSALTAEFAAGPNPAGKSSGGVVRFFHNGAAVKSADLSVYDASGNAVRKVSVSDRSSAGVQSKRQVGSWDLRDGKGRSVPAGMYAVRGAVTTKDGKREKVSLVVGVR